MAYHNLQDYLKETMTPRPIYNTALLLSESTILQETVSTSQNFHSHAATAVVVQSCIEGVHGRGKQGPGTQPSAQLANYLISPPAEDPYTGVAGSEGIGVVKQHEKDMEEYLHGWEKDWQKIAAAKEDSKK